MKYKLKLSMLIFLAALTSGFLYSQEPEIFKGCWVSFYEGTNFQGRHFTFQGPLEIDRLRFPGFIEWEGGIKSLRTGPRAHVMIYADIGLNNPEFLFAGGISEPNLTRIPQWQNMASMELSCIN